MNQFYRFFLIVCMVLVAAACDHDAESDPQTERRTAVTIDCAGAFGVDVRTFVGGQLSNGDLVIGWDEADRFRLWSFKSSDGTPVTSGADFALYHYDMTFPVARFKGEVDLTAYNAGGGIYNYYAVSPVPASESDVQGTRVSYAIPDVQTGQFDGKLDILTAQLLNAPALAEDHNPDIRLQFQHQVHVLRIAIPENRMGEDIRAMELTFPEGVNVVGRLTVDATGANDPVLTEGSNVVRLNFAEPKKVGDVVYVTIAPTTIPAEGVISMRIIGRTGETSTTCLGGVARTMAAGHFSPVELRVPQMKVRYTLLTFRLPEGLGVNTLGEAVNKVKITPSDGSSLAGATLPDNTVLESSELTYGVNSDDGRDYSIMLLPDVAEGIIAGLNGKVLTAAFESENAWNLTSTVAGKTLALNNENVYELSVPYLMQQEFVDSDGNYYSGNDGHDNPGAADENVDGSELGSKINAGLTGWTGAHIGVQNGVIRICCRTERVGAQSRYHGRLDSEPLSRLRPTAKVKVKVTLDYSGSTNNSKATPKAAHGYTTQTGVINSGSGDDWLNTISGSVAFPKLPTNGSYTSGFINNYSYEIADCGASHRLSWDVNSDGQVSFIGNANSWLYMRNIRVSIVH